MRSSTLRMVLTAITNAEVAGKEARELTDDDVLGVLTSEAKKRREAAEAFDDAGRAELAAKERAEAAVIADYLPEQLTAEEIAALVTSTIAELGVAGRGHARDGQGHGRAPAPDQGSCRRRAVAAEVRRQLGCDGRPSPRRAAVAAAVGRATWPPPFRRAAGCCVERRLLSGLGGPSGRPCDGRS